MFIHKKKKPPSVIFGETEEKVGDIASLKGFKMIDSDTKNKSKENKFRDDVVEFSYRDSPLERMEKLVLCHEKTITKHADIINKIDEHGVYKCDKCMMFEKEMKNMLQKAEILNIISISLFIVSLIFVAVLIYTKM